MAVDRYECLKSMVNKIDDEDILLHLAIGATKFETWHLRPKANTVSLGKLGGTVAFGLGIAIALPHRRVITITTDGDLLMELGQLSPIVAMKPSNLKIVVLDNEHYESLKTVRPSLTGNGLDLATIAKGSGIKYSKTAFSLEDFNKLFIECLSIPESTFIVVKTELGKSNAPVRKFDAVEDKFRFIRWVEETEKTTITGHEQQDKILIKEEYRNTHN